MEIRMKKTIRITVALLMLAVIALFASCNEVPSGKKDYLELEGLLYRLSEDGKSYAVAGYTDIGEEVTVPADINGLPVTELGNSAFYNATELRRISLPNTVVKIDDYAFDNCYKLESPLLPSSVEFIGFNAFSDCSSIKSLVFPNALVEIESCAFERCSSIERIAIQPSLEKIGRDVFDDCSNLKELHIADLAAWCAIEFATPESNPLYYADKVFIAGEESADLVIEGVECISDYAFYKCRGITSLTLGEGVREIGVSAFSECETLKKVTLSDSLETINTSAFSFCSSLEEISFGRGINYFGGLAFYDCNSLVRVNIADLALWCGVHFYTDNSGTSNPLHYADELAVNGELITDLVIPSGVTTVSSLAFINFQGFKTVTVPRSVKTIEENAFYMCASIGRVVYLGSRDEWRSVSIGQGNASFAYAALWVVFG